ncbi:MAG: TonB-dependent receptor [Magnetococcales bacterium]|nr:TonB-dependent receptor [Magnetococcales bacterium]
MHRPSSFTLLSLLLPILPAVAGETPSQPDVTLEETVVTATRFPVQRNMVPAHVTTIGREEIRESGAASVPELLRLQTGIHVMDMTGNGRNHVVDLRGFGESASTNTLVLVDGRRINQADLGGVDWLQIPLERIERIEILRGGSGGVLYGDNASGGVVNIITRTGTEKPVVEIKAQGGSHGAAATHLSVEGKTGSLSYALTGGLRSEDGYRDNSDNDLRNAGLSLRFQPTESFGIRFATGYQHDTTGLPSALKESDFAKGMTRTATVTPDDKTKTTDSFFHLTPELRFNGADRFSLDLSWRDREAETFSNFTGGQFTGETATHVWSISPRVQLHRSWDKIADHLTFGGDLHTDQEKIRNDSLFFGVRTQGDFSLRKANRGAYLHNEIHLPERWILTQGGRLDRAEFYFLPSTPERVVMDSQAYAFGVRHDLNDTNHLYVNLSRSFRYPLLDEQYSFFTNTVNTALKSQRSLEYQLGWQREFSPTLTGELSLFRVATRDEIFFDILSFNNANLDGQVQRDGVELELKKQFEHFSLTGHTTWTKAEIRTGSFDGKAFPGVPTFKSGATLKVFPTEAMTWELTGRYVGTRPFISDFGNSFGEQASYVVLDTGLRYQWSKVTGWIDVTNLTGREYAEYGVLGGFPTERAWFPSAERRFMVGASARF